MSDLRLAPGTLAEFAEMANKYEADAKARYERMMTVTRLMRNARTVRDAEGVISLLDRIDNPKLN